MKVFEALKHEDHKKALLASLIFIMLMILFFLLVSLKEPDPPIRPEVIEIEMPDVEIIEEGSQAAGGSESASQEEVPVPVNEVEEPARDIVTQEEETTPVPSGNGSSNNESTQQESEPQPDSDFSFPGSGTGGAGAGTGGNFGSGTGVGGDGTGNTPGDGAYNPNRKMKTAPNFNSNAQEEGRIALDIWVDANGNVVKTRFKESKSTSGSQYLIRLAEKAAKTMKYDKKPGAASEHVGYKVFEFRKS